MRARIAGVALVLLLAGCGEETSAPAGPLLVGQWGVIGDSPASLVALRVAAELQFGCSSIGVHHAVELLPEGRFAFEGRMQRSGIASGGLKARVSGRVEAERVILTADVLDDDVPPQSLTLQAGVDPRFDRNPIPCPL